MKHFLISCIFIVALSQSAFGYSMEISYPSYSVFYENRLICENDYCVEEFIAADTESYPIEGGYPADNPPVSDPSTRITFLYDDETFNSIVTFSITWHFEDWFGISSYNLTPLNYSVSSIFSDDTVTKTYSFTAFELGEGQYFDCPWENLNSPFGLTWNEFPNVVDQTKVGEAHYEYRWAFTSDVELLSVTSQPVPEPTTGIIFTIGLLGLFCKRKILKHK